MGNQPINNIILPFDRLRNLLTVIGKSLGFEIIFQKIDGEEKSEISRGADTETVEITGYRQRAYLKGPRDLMDRMKETIIKISEMESEQERENVSLTEEIVERYEQLSLLFNMSDRLGSAKDNMGRMVAILKTAVEAVGAEDGCLLMDNMERCVSWKNENDKSDQFLKLAQKTILEGQHSIDEKRYFALPLKIHNGATIGSLVLGAKCKGVYRSGDVKILSTLGAYASLLLESGRLYEDLESLFFSTIKSMVEAIDAKDTSTRGHSERVRRYSHVIGEGLGFADEELKSLELAALLHDVGKIGLPDVILSNEKEYLSENQWEMVRMHPEIGVSILSHVAQLKSILPAIGQHHERFDGQGYPNGIDGENITLFARIIAVADAFDAMTMNRSYRFRFSRDKALQELAQNSGSQFDPQLVRLFIDNIHKTEIILDE